ncbi:hypothetical protein TVAGG3_0782980 [Trichomonas vaginalis G3]|nr:uncharacterized protein TVAGG3_1076830 [Trichomonas vaginalis G3]XP_053744486.1 hypothetical protein TVAGG3_0782980 [Trichomonas vaginalis G3]KAI5482852.1 hypothetical protein TVAGG3_1076830 [Trichomonas vaginalis G3]KAI5495190.1 hypothetical protein TVAGG3_0782980 [Trichomonas vaginalis G3]
MSLFLLMEKRKIKKIIVDEGTEEATTFIFDDGKLTFVVDKNGQHLHKRKRPRKFLDLPKARKPKEPFPVPAVQEPERLLIPKPVVDKYDPDQFFPKIPKLE